METKDLGIHKATYNAVFQHPIARNLQWRDVQSMLIALSDVTEERAGNFKFTRNGQSVMVHPPQRKDFSDIQEVMQIRHFLERSSTSVNAASEPAGTHLLVVIDHRMARIFKTEFHSVPQLIVPYDAAGAGKHLHYVEDSTGRRKPESKSFYADIAKTLGRADKILIFGSGTGSSSAMNHLLEDLRLHHKSVSDRVIGAHVVDEHHLTDDQLLAKAREIYMKLAAGVN